MHATTDLHYTVVDVETTGFSPAKGDRVIEVAALRVTADGTPVERLSTLVNPGRDVGPTRIHRVTDDMVADAPPFSAVARPLASLLDGSVVVAHNAAFDAKFLSFELAAAGIGEPLPMLCSMRLTDLLLLDRVADRKLATLADLFGLELDGAHAAYADVRATAAILAGYLHIAVRRGQTTLADLAGAFVGPAEPVSLPAGHHRQLAEVNRTEVADLLDAPYPARPAGEALARYCPPDDPDGAAAWLDKLASYRQRISCPDCGRVTRIRTRTRDGSRFRGCTGYPDCRWTADLESAA